jgi:hypothetical protein
LKTTVVAQEGKAGTGATEIVRSVPGQDAGSLVTAFKRVSFLLAKCPVVRAWGTCARFVVVSGEGITELRFFA